MNAAVAVEEPRLLHAVPGRMRVQLAGWPREGPCAVETRLRQVPGVLNVQANPLTGNVLVHFDTSATDAQAILAAVQTLKPDSISVRGEILPSSPVVPRRHRWTPSAPGAMLRSDSDPDVVYSASIVQSGRPRLLILAIVDLILKGACVVLSLILADSPLGLILGGAEVVRLFMEVLGRQSAWRRDELWQERSLLILIAPGNAGAVDAPEPMAQGRPRHDAGFLDNYATGEAKGVPM